jgi:hypothetical protein
LENIKDVAREHNWDASWDERATVVHEVGHAVGRTREENITRTPGEPCRYTEVQWLRMRSIPKPFNPSG